ncbi:hypothetical protein KORDIASMS9_03634 [Kordia sp. SMS9]|uniref:hypothetical protein n=1 Tax=Kordia sp. SMS9 TaxID=2282170 RepID=UPI000E0D87C6|nr:hypothetical protein [Kordia sp. SMS9]AXG71377.1 hypothetical protein KORDIASMS9_03634 [Kordia sp. SMS9]
MKKKMIAFASMGLVCLTFFLSCKANDQIDEELVSSVLEKPEKIISTKDAAILFTNDHLTRLSSIGKASTTFKEKAIHFELAELTKYFQHLETIATTKNIPITGISFVFGATNDGKRTTFMMPSIRNAQLDYQASFTIENEQIVPFVHIDDYVTARTVSNNDENLILSPNGYISFNEATVLFNSYQTKYIERIAKKVKRDYYTKAVWYSLAEIKSYINYLQRQSQAYNLEITGIDVFFGVYDTNPDLELKSNAQTVFLTANAQTQTIIDRKASRLSHFLQNDFFRKDTASDESEDESLAYNEGQLCPPPKNN